MQKIKKKKVYCPICDKEYTFYSKNESVKCIACGHHLALKDCEEETISKNIHNSINKDIFKEFDNLLTKYGLSSTSYLEKQSENGVEYYDKHIQINLVIPDFCEDKKDTTNNDKELSKSDYLYYLSRKEN